MLKGQEAKEWVEKRNSLALPLSERDRRYQLVRRLMARDKIDCLVLYSIGASASNNKFEADIRYLTGEFHKTLYADEFLVFPLKGKPCFIPTSPFQLEAIKKSWISEVKAPKDLDGKEMKYANDQTQVLSTLIEALLERGYERGVIGLPRNLFPVYGYEQLVEALPKVKFVGISPLMVEARRIKSEFEIRLQEESARIADLAALRCREVLRPGILEHQIVAEWDYVLKLNGCEKSYELIGSGPLGATMHWPQRPRLIERGDMITTEISPCFGGYFTQLNRAFSIGKPNPKVLDMAEVCQAAHNAGAEKLKPGVSVGDVARAIQNVTTRAGYLEVSRPGHGSAGIDLPEIGMVEEDTTLLEPNVVVILHPSAVVPDYTIGKPCYAGPGDTYVITEYGHRRLNKLAQDLIVITE